MNILSSPLWPSDMPDDRRVIALLGMVQISEEGMEKIDVLIKCLPDAPFKERLVEEIGKKDAEIERLTAIVSLQTEALKYAISDLTIRAKLSDDDSLNIGQGCLDQMNEALSATAETVSAWQSTRDIASFERGYSKCMDDNFVYADSAVEIYANGKANGIKASQERDNEIRDKAIKKEREECAQLAEAHFIHGHSIAGPHFAAELAKRIRAKGE